MILHPEQPSLFDPRPDPERERAELRRDLGATRAEARASRIDPAWRERALEALRLHASRFPTFLLEDVVPAAPVPEGADPRSWGAIAVEGRRRGWIAHAGFAPANSSNRSPKVLWKSNLTP